MFCTFSNVLGVFIKHCLRSVHFAFIVLTVLTVPFLYQNCTEGDWYKLQQASLDDNYNDENNPDVQPPSEIDVDVDVDGGNDGDVEEVAEPCDRFITPYAEGEVVVISKPTESSAEITVTCQGTTDSYIETAREDGLIVRELGCNDEEGSPQVASIEVAGVEPGGWYYVRGDRNVAVAPLVCKSDLDNSSVVKAVDPGGVTTVQGEYGTFIRHNTEGWIAIVSDVPSYEGDEAHVAPYWRGHGGIVGRPVNGEESITVQIDCHVQAADDLVTVSVHEQVLTADPNTGLVVALIEQKCGEESLSENLEVSGMEDGGWYWIKGDSNVTVSSLIRKSAVSEEDPNPFDPGGVSVDRGYYGTLFVREGSQISGIVPRGQ